MNRKNLYIIPVLIALMSLLYQAMPIHKLISVDSSMSISSVEDDDDTAKEETNYKKLKSEVDDFITTNPLTILVSSTANTIYYFHHLPKSYEVNSVFAPPPESV